MQPTVQKCCRGCDNNRKMDFVVNPDGFVVFGAYISVVMPQKPLQYSYNRVFVIGLRL